MDAHGLRYIMNCNTQIIARIDKKTVRRMITAISRISSTKNYPFISWNWRGQDQANILKTGTLRGSKHVLSLEIFWMNKTINEVRFRTTWRIIQVSVPVLGTWRSNDADGNEKVKKITDRFNKQNNYFARAPHFFVHFFPVFARLGRENTLFRVYGGRKQATTKFYFSFWAWIWSFEI